MATRNSEHRICIWPGNLQTNPAIEARVHHALGPVLHRYGPSMTAVEVYLERLTSPRRGRHDICCVLEARVNGRSPVAVQACCDDLYPAIDAAAGELEVVMRGR